MINIDYSLSGVKESDFKNKKIEKLIRFAHDNLHALDRSSGTGWVEFPSLITEEEIGELKTTADKIKQTSKVFVVIGIGGSYAGIKAGLELVKPSENAPKILFMGTTFSAEEISNVIEEIKEQDASVCVISKSGNTTETLLAFNIIETFLKKKYKKGQGYKDRIFVITDYEKGFLREKATIEGYKSFIIPRTIGGRYSALTPVGLLPFAVAGLNIEEIIDGAKAMYRYCYNLNYSNPAYVYALLRYILHTKHNKKIEFVTTFDDRYPSLYEWQKQLFLESEGKEGKGLFMATGTYSTDLHSVGQFIQEGSPILFETIIDIKEPAGDFSVQGIEENSPIKVLEGKTIKDVIKATEDGVIKAHHKAGVPIIKISVDEVNEKSFGAFIQFFQIACATSAYLLGVNPFNQPGVEEYKKNTRENFNN